MIGDQAGGLLELLVQINREVAGAIDLRTVLQRLVGAAVKHVGGERGSIIVLDDAGTPIDATILYGTTLHEHTAKQLKETVDRGLAGWVVRHRQPALVPDTSRDGRWLRRPDDADDRSGPKAAVCVPLVARDRLVGVLTLVHSVPGAFGPEHLELTKAIADQASIAVLNARLYSDSTRQARIMTALADGAAEFSSSLDVHEVWQRVLHETLGALQVETAAIGLLEGPKQSVVFRAAAGRGAEIILGQQVNGESGLIHQVIRDGSGVVIADTAEDPRYTEADRFAGIEQRAVAVAPIQAQGRIMGVLEAINPISPGFDPDALTVMTGLGGLAGTTISNAQLFQQLQQAHQRYQELFEESIDPIFITDWDGKITEANRRAASLSRYSPDALRSARIDQLHDVNWNKVGTAFHELREADRPIYDSLLHTADSRSIPVEVHARRVEFEATDSILWTMRDVTERKQLDVLRQDLTSMIYHDLQAPLGNVASSLDLLRGTLGTDETARSMLDVAMHSTGRMQRLVSSLLDIDRLEAGQSVTTLTATSPNELVERAVQDVAQDAEGRNQIIRTSAAGKLPQLLVDGDMIRRVLINLLENAIKFSEAGSLIDIGARREGSAVQFWVQDHGPGIPAAEQQRIFEKFTRLADGPQRPRGLGIGLAFCQLAVRAHGGVIRVDSQEGGGSRFVFGLPVKRRSV